jgi:hypothetical protein
VARGAGPDWPYLILKLYVVLGIHLYVVFDITAEWLFSKRPLLFSPPTLPMAATGGRVAERSFRVKEHSKSATRSALLLLLLPNQKQN